MNVRDANHNAFRKAGFSVQETVDGFRRMGNVIDIRSTLLWVVVVWPKIERTWPQTLWAWIRGVP